MRVYKYSYPILPGNRVSNSPSEPCNTINWRNCWLLLIVCLWIIHFVSTPVPGGQDEHALKIPPVLGPVSEFSGNVFLVDEDLEIPGNLEIRLSLTRTYNSRSQQDGIFGVGWFADPLDIKIVIGTDGKLRLTGEQGQEEIYSTLNGADYFPAPEGNTRGFGVSLENDGTYLLLLKDGSYWRFNSKGYLVSRQDSSGNLLNVKRAANGLTPEYIEGPFGKRIGFRYKDNRIVAAEGPGGLRCQYSYDRAGRLSRKIDPVGQEALFSYDASGHLTSAKLIGEPLQGFEYRQGLLSTHTVAEVGSYSFRYLPLGDQGTHGYVQETSNELGTIIRKIEVRDSGRVRVEIDRFGNRTVLRFDKAGRLISRKAPVGREEKWSFNEMGILESYDDRLANLTTYQWNAGGTTLTVTGPRGSTYTKEYDSRGLLTRTTDPWGISTEFRRDQRGRVVETYYDSQLILRNHYNTDGYLERIEGEHNWAFERDGAGYVSRMEDAEGGEEIYENDLLGRPIYRADGEGRALRWAYDQSGKLMSITDGEGGRVEFSRSKNGMLQILKDAGGNEYRFDFEGEALKGLTFPNKTSESFTIDQRGRLTQHTDHQGVTVEYELDKLGRVIRQRSDNQYTSWTYNELGQLAYASNDNASYYINYNQFGDIEEIKDSKGRILRYLYNDMGQRVAIIDPEGKKTSYEYDRRGALSRIVGPEGEKYLFEYDIAGQLVKKQYPNGIVATFFYDRMGSISRIIHTDQKGNVFDSIRVTRDHSGKAITLYAKEGVWQYTYDLAGRLVNVRGPDGHEESFSYDKAGNRIVHVRKGKRFSLTYGALNEILSDGEFEYTHNKNGERILRSDGMEYQYNALGQLSEVKSAEGKVIQYFYDPFGRLVGREIDGKQTKYLYDKENVIAEYRTGAVAPDRRYVHGPGLDDPLAFWEKGGFHTYTLGLNNSVRSIHGPDGGHVNAYRFGPFGEFLHSAGRTENQYMFNARYWDDVAQLYYVRARFLDPRTGRFISTDPIRFRGEWNLYVYANNDPINQVDPLGLRSLNAEAIKNVLRSNKAKRFGIASAVIVPLRAVARKLGYTEESYGGTVGGQASYVVGGKGGWNYQHFGPQDPRTGEYLYLGPGIGQSVGGGGALNIAWSRPGAEWEGLFVEIETPWGGGFFSFPTLEEGIPVVGYVPESIASPSVGWQIAVTKYVKHIPAAKSSQRSSYKGPKIPVMSTPSPPTMAPPGWSPPPPIPEGLAQAIDSHNKQLQALAKSAKSKAAKEEERKRLQQLAEQAKAEELRKAEEAREKEKLALAIQKAIEYATLAQQEAAEAKTALEAARRGSAAGDCTRWAVETVVNSVQRARAAVKGTISACEGAIKPYEIETASKKAATFADTVRGYTQDVENLTNETCELAGREDSETKNLKVRANRVNDWAANAEMFFKKADQEAQQAVDGNTYLKQAIQAAKQAGGTIAALQNQIGQAEARINECEEAIRPAQEQLKNLGAKVKNAENYKNLGLGALDPYSSVPEVKRLINRINAISLPVQGEVGEVSQGLQSAVSGVQQARSSLGNVANELNAWGQDLARCETVEAPDGYVSKAISEVNSAKNTLEKIKKAATRAAECARLAEKKKKEGRETEESPIDETYGKFAKTLETRRSQRPPSGTGSQYEPGSTTRFGTSTLGLAEVHKGLEAGEETQTTTGTQVTPPSGGSTPVTPAPPAAAGKEAQYVLFDTVTIPFDQTGAKKFQSKVPPKTNYDIKIEVSGNFSLWKGQGQGHDAAFCYDTEKCGGEIRKSNRALMVDGKPLTPSYKLLTGTRVGSGEFSYNDNHVYTAYYTQRDEPRAIEFEICPRCVNDGKLFPTVEQVSGSLTARIYVKQ